jgi:hypothetical protein
VWCDVVCVDGPQWKKKKTPGWMMDVSQLATNEILSRVAESRRILFFIPPPLMIIKQ